MKKFALTFVISLMLFTCSKDNNDNERFEYNYFENSKLNVERLPDSYMKIGKVEEGDKTVFKYEYHFDEDARVADGGYSDYIYFEIDKNLENFEIRADELISSQTILTKSCFCWFPEEEEKNVSPSGYIKGTKISNNKWRIDLDVTFYGDENRKVNGVFNLKEL